MQSIFSNALSELTKDHIRLTRTRQETLIWLVLLVLRQGTVCLWRLAAHAPSRARTASVRRRFYRFFQFVQIDAGAAAQIVVRLLGLKGKPWVLAMDRSNWDFGRTSINILMISVMWNGVGVPLLWTFLSKTGNSSTRERTQLLDRLHAIFPDMKIASLTGDREFIGETWMGYLISRKIPFVLRLRENQYVRREGYARWPISRIAQNLKCGERMVLKQACRLGEGAPPVRIVIMRLKTGELLALACLSRPRQALAAYRRRWTVETLFANLKTRGFDMEATHLTHPGKLSTLMAILAIGTALAVKTGAAVNAARPIPIKKHGRKAVSIFAHGLAHLRKLFAAPYIHHATVFLKAILSNRMPSKPLLNVAFT